MTSRLATTVLVSALRRRAEREGGVVTIIARGDESAGGLMLICCEKGRLSGIFDLGYSIDGRMIWRPGSAQVIDNDGNFRKNVEARRRFDPDLWVIELDIPDAERFAAQFAAAT